MTTELQTTVNPFANDSKLSGGYQTNALVDIEAQKSIAEVQAKMAIAKKFPRDELAATDKILRACTRKTLAESAMYSYNRGGAEVTGPSIRLAETIAQTWGNFECGIRELSQTNGSSTVEAFAWDIENNTRQSKIFQVPHIRYSRNKGNTPLTDPRDVYEKIANDGARRLRACILAAIPGDVVEAAVSQCELTLKANADTSPDAIKKLVEAFNGFSVSEEMLQKRIGNRLEAIRPAQVLQLRKIYMSLKDGMSKVADWFELVQESEKLSDNPLNNISPPATKTRKKIEPAPIVDGVDQATGEVVDKTPEMEINPEAQKQADNLL